MSKDLEKEYRALVNSKAPDLWARIEVGLEEKTGPSHHKKLAKKKWHFKMWVGFAAACICVVLCIPVITRHFSSSDSNLRDNNTVSMECAPEVAEYRVAEVADEAALEEGVYPAAMNEEYDSVGRDSNAVVSGGTGNNGVNMEAAEQENGSFTVTAEVVDIDVRRDSGIVYTINIIASENTDIQTGSTIKIFSSALTTEGVITLEKAQSYQLTLVNDTLHSAKEEVIYTLQAVENQ